MGPPPQAFDIQLVEVGYETARIRFEASSQDLDGQAISYVVFATASDLEGDVVLDHLVEVAGVDGPVEADLAGLLANTQYAVSVVTTVMQAEGDSDNSHLGHRSRPKSTVLLQVPDGPQCKPLLVRTLPGDVVFSRIEVKVTDPALDDLEVLSLFRIFDLNGDGYIDQDELERVMRMLAPEIWTDRKLRQLMAAMSLNADGKVDIQGFLAWITGKLKDTDDEFFCPPPTSGELLLEWSGLQLGPHWLVTVVREPALEIAEAAGHRDVRMRMATCSSPCTSFTALPCGVYRIEVKAAMPGGHGRAKISAPPRAGRCWVCVGSNDLSHVTKRLPEVCRVGLVEPFGDHALVERVVPD